MKAKGLVMLAMAIVLAVIITGCGNKNDAADGGKKKVVGVLIGDFSNQFHSYIMDGMKEEEKKYPDVEFVYVDGKFDPATQLSQSENFVTQKVDAIIFLPGDSEGTVPAFELIANADIPIINVNTPAKDLSKVTTYVGSNSVESGEILMEAMAEVMGGKGNMVELEGMYGHEPQIERHKGIENILKKYPDIKVLTKDTGKWNREDGLKKMENWLQSDLRDSITAVVSHNDEMAVGAMKALEDAGMLDKVVIGGIDATPDALKFLKEGKIAVTVFQDAQGQGAQAIQLAVKALNGETLEKEYMIPYKRVKKEEADQYLAMYNK